MLNQSDILNRVAFVAMSDLVDAYAILLLEGFQNKIVHPSNRTQIFTMRQVAMMMISVVKGSAVDANNWIGYTNEAGVIPDYTEWLNRVPVNLGLCYAPKETVLESIVAMTAT
jgi:protein gp37